MSLEPVVDESHNVSASSNSWSHGVGVDNSQGQLFSEEDLAAVFNQQSAYVTSTPQYRSPQTANISTDQEKPDFQQYFTDNASGSSLIYTLVDEPGIQEEVVSHVIHVPVVDEGSGVASDNSYFQSVNSPSPSQQSVSSFVASPSPQSKSRPQLVYTLQTGNSPARARVVCTPRIGKSPLRPYVAQTPQAVNSTVRAHLVHSPQTADSPVKNFVVHTPQTVNSTVGQNVVHTLQTVNSPIRSSLVHIPQTANSPVGSHLVGTSQTVNSPGRPYLLRTPQTLNSPVRSALVRTPQTVNSPVRSALVRTLQNLNSPIRSPLVRTPQTVNSHLRSALARTPEALKTADIGTSQIISSTNSATKTVVVTSPAKSTKIAPEVIQSLSRTLCDGDLQPGMLYNIQSNHHNTRNRQTIALWNGTEFLEVPEAEKYITELNQTSQQICNANGASKEPKKRSVGPQHNPPVTLGKRSASTLSVLKQLKAPLPANVSVRPTSSSSLTQKPNGAVSNLVKILTNGQRQVNHPIGTTKGENSHGQLTVAQGNSVPSTTVIAEVVRNPAGVKSVNSNSTAKSRGRPRIYVRAVKKPDGRSEIEVSNASVIRNIPVQKQIIVQNSNPQQQFVPRQIQVQRTVLAGASDNTAVPEQAPVPEQAQQEPLPEPVEQEPEEQLAPDEFKVCKNCGNLSKNPRTCEGCGKACGNYKTFKKDLGEEKLFKSSPDALKAPVKSVLTKQNFYGTKLQEQWKPYNSTSEISSGVTIRKRKPLTSKRKAEPETVIISSDEGETDCDTSTNRTEESSTKGADSLQPEPCITSPNTSSTNSTPVRVASANQSAVTDTNIVGRVHVSESSVVQSTSNQYNNKFVDTSQPCDSTTTTPDRKHSKLGLPVENFAPSTSIIVEGSSNQETVQRTFPTEHVEKMGTRRDRMEDAEGNIPRKSQRQAKKTKVAAEPEKQLDVEKNISLTLKVRYVSFGQMRGFPVQPVFFSKEGIFIKMECEDKGLEIQIPPAEMENVATHLNERLPTIYIKPSPNCAQRLGRENGWTKEQFNSDCGDSKLKFITLLLDHVCTKTECEYFDSLFKYYQRIKPHQPQFLQLLNYEEAQNVFVQTAGTLFSSPMDADSSTHNSATEDNLSGLGPHVAVEKLLIYRTPPEKGGITITTEDLYCLTEGEFLNDVIIDFYLKYLKAEVLSEESNERTYVFSSFFYKGLTQKLARGTGDKQIDLKVRRHENMKTWTRRVDLFSKDFIVIPINEHAHWFLAIICFPGMVPEKSGSALSCPNGQASSQEEPMDQSFDSNLRPDEETEEPQQPPSNSKFCHKQPCILVFDSLAGPARTTVVRTLRDYLSVEWKVKKQTDKLFDRVTMRGGYPKVPQQNNCSDCGIYLLQYVESFFEHPIKDFSIPIKGLQDWFTDERVGRKRGEIRDLILSLREKSVNEQNKSAS